MLFIRGKLAQAIHRQKLPKMCCFSSLQHNNALMFLSPKNCPYLMIVRFNNCLYILAYIICGVLLKTAKISSWAWNLVGFIIIIITYFISQKEICLGSMIVKSIGMIFNTPGIKKKFQRKLYDSGEKCEYTYAIMKINQRYGMS